MDFTSFYRTGNLPELEEPELSLYSDRVKKDGKKDQQDQVGLLGNWLQQWKNSCIGGHQKSTLQE